MAGFRNARATSAGGVIYRSDGGLIEVVLVHRRRPLLWALPKGTPDSGETLQETALREAREETGIRVEIEAPLRAIEYFFVRRNVRFHKTVHFFLMRPTGGALEEHDAEFDEARWVQLEEAAELLTYPTEQLVLAQAAELLRRRADDRRASA